MQYQGSGLRFSCREWNCLSAPRYPCDVLPFRRGQFDPAVGMRTQRSLRGFAAVPNAVDLDAPARA